MSDLQSLVDALASDLGRPVGLDDRQFRSLAYSSHVEELDRVRLSSILQREAPKAVTEYLTSLGIDEVDDHIRIPANPRFGMVARVCLPVRFGATLLGYTWLSDEPALLSAQELVLARRFADDAAAVLFRSANLRGPTATANASCSASGQVGEANDPVRFASSVWRCGWAQVARNSSRMVARCGCPTSNVPAALGWILPFAGIP